MHGRAAQFEVGKICMHVAVMTTPQSPGPNYDPNSVS